MANVPWWGQLIIAVVAIVLLIYVLRQLGVVS